MISSVTRLERSNRWVKYGQNLISGGMELVWPARCEYCSSRIDSQSLSLCHTCWEQILLDMAGDACPRCGGDVSPYALYEGACPACQGLELYWDQLVRCGVYSGLLRALILEFKHGKSELDCVLGRLLREIVEAAPFFRDIDIWLPVPLHWTRRLLRGYNQAQLLLKQLRVSTKTERCHLKRIRRTQFQPTVVTSGARKRNVANAFSLNGEAGFTGKTVCLVDDIKTSGATLNECSRILKAAGAKHVHACVLAVAGQRLK